MSGKLYLCATPIGNLEDITLRVLNCLKSVDLIAAEDTRHTLGLLNHYGIKAELTSYHEHNKYEKACELVLKLQDGKNIALVTDAGTPGISDPGEELVKKCYEAGVEVTALPGACALAAAVSVSGLSSRRFVFEGFLPVEKKERAKAFERLVSETRTIVIYEAPHRILKTLKEIKEHIGNRNICICRELTKIHEEILKFNIDQAIFRFEETPPKGEMVILIEGADSKLLEQQTQKSWQDMDIKEHVSVYTDRGMNEKEAMKQAAADRGISKREIYAAIKINST